MKVLWILALSCMLVPLAPAETRPSDDRFVVRNNRSPVRAQAIVIHEVLHTLGLGENPPSSTEITARVLARCQQ